MENQQECLDVISHRELADFYISQLLADGVQEGYRKEREALAERIRRRMLLESQEMFEGMREGLERKTRAIVERIRRGAVIEPGPYRFDLKTLKVEED